MLSREEAVPRIEAALERALDLDPHNADALAVKGKMLWRPDVEAAESRRWSAAPP